MPFFAKGSFENRSFAEGLLAWYDANRRELPWRSGGDAPIDPYRVWISEIMLQQTTVQTVIPYYERFIERWPSLLHLARASLDEVLHAWQGLGYYSRARSLHQCAQILVDQYRGHFPSKEKELRQLPGVGPYTAGALLSIAFQKPAVAVDGNVIRVLSRYFALPDPLPGLKGIVTQKAQQILPNERPGDYTQALMDLGALVCRPWDPQCGICPLEDGCIAKAQQQVELYPHRQKRSPLPQRYGAVFWAVRPDGCVLVSRQKNKGLLGGLIAFPTTPWEGVLSLQKEIEFPVSGIWALSPQVVHHTFTHFKLSLSIWTGEVQPEPVHPQFFWLHPHKFSDYAFSTCMKKVASICTENP